MANPVSTSFKQVDVPVLVFHERGKGSYGKFRYDQYHIAQFNGESAIKQDLIPEGAELLEGIVRVPELSVARIGNVARWLTFGANQEGLYTGRNRASNNCARFVHDVLGIDFDRRLLEDSRYFDGWEARPRAQEHKPQIGEVLLYTRPHAGSWAHWALAVETNGFSGNVMGLGGPNGHAISIADSNDVAKALGNTLQNTAVHSSQKTG